MVLNNIKKHRGCSYCHRPERPYNFHEPCRPGINGWNIEDATGKSIDGVYDISTAKSPEESMNTGEIELICRDGQEGS